MNSQDSLIYRLKEHLLFYKCYTIFLITCIIGLGVSAAFLSCFVLHGPARKLEKLYAFSPNESRVLNYSSTWCSAVTVESKPSVNNKLSLLKEEPKASDHDTFSIVRHSEVLYNKVKYYKFHLYPGSHVNMTACAVVANEVGIATVLVITGHSNFKMWQDSASTSFSFADTSFKISDFCDNSTKLHHLISKVPNEEDYYLVFFTPVSAEAVMIEVSFQFYRTKLTISNPLDYCTSTDGELCYLDIGYKQGYPLVVSVDSPKYEDQDKWLNGYSVTLKCTDRYSLYFVIGSALIVFCLLVASVAPLLFGKIGHKLSGNKYSRMSPYQTFKY